MVKKALKYLLLFAVLWSATWLLLELPEIYFRIQEERLLTERGQSIYELKTVNRDMLLFSDKLELFKNGKGYMLDKEVVFQEEMITEAEKRVAEEIDALLNGMYEPVTKALTAGEADSQGFSVGVIYTEKDKTYTWDIGVFVFETYSPHWGGIVFYDMDTGKLFYLSMEMIDDMDGKTEKMLTSQEFGEKDWQPYVEEYYEGISVPWKEAEFEIGRYVLIAPMSWLEWENSTMVSELSMLCEKLFLRREEELIFYEKSERPIKNSGL